MTEPGFQHEALIYSDGDDFLAGTVPFLRCGLEAGEPALVAVSRGRMALLEGELGEATAEVRFADMEELGCNPARIIPFWSDFVDEHEGRPIRGIGEPVWPGRRHHEIDECQRHEALLNLAFDGAPAWSLLCPYDAGALADDVLARVAESHRHVDGIELAAGAPPPLRTESDCFAGELPGRAPLMDAFGFSRDGLAQVRRRVEQAAALAGLVTDRSADLVLAASEVAANSVVHGGGAGTVRIWRHEGCLIVEFEDRGRIEEQLAGRRRPALTQQSGRGLWLANQLCDLVQIRSGAQGTTVRLHATIGGFDR